MTPVRRRRVTAHRDALERRAQFGLQCRPSGATTAVGERRRLTPMSRWSDFESSAPEIAAAGRCLLFAQGIGYAFLGTVRKDGGPRLHPIYAPCCWPP